MIHFIKKLFKKKEPKCKHRNQRSDIEHFFFKTGQYLGAREITQKKGRLVITCTDCKEIIHKTKWRNSDY